MTARAACALALLLLGCAREPPAAPAPLAAVPWPDLARANPAVVEQIAEQRRALERSGQSDQELAARYAATGVVLTTYEFLDAAEVCFANGATLAAGDYRYLYLHGYLLAMKGRGDEAARLLGRALALRPDHLAGALRLANLRLDQGDTPAARELFEQTLARHPESAAALAGLGRALAQSGDDRAAAASFERALSLEPGANSLHYLLAQVYRRLGDPARAQHHLERRGDLQVPIPDPLTQSVPTLARTADFFRAQAGEAMENERYDIAAVAYRRALERDAHDLTSYRGLAFSLYELGDRAGALAVLERALTAALTDHGQRAELYRLIGEQHVLAERDDEAIRAFERALAAVPERADARLLLANALARRARFAEAVSHYQWLLGGKPNDAALRARYATALYNLGQHAAASAELERAYRDDPRDPIVGEARAGTQDAGPVAPSRDDALRRARSSVEQGDVERAGSFYRQALALAPDDPEARLGLAAVLGHQRRFAEAAEQFRRVSERYPRTEGAWLGEVSALALGDDWRQARERLRAGLEALPRHRGLAHALARLLVATPRAADRNGALALELVVRLEALGGREPAVTATRAMALAELGRFSEAVEKQRAVTVTVAVSHAAAPMPAAHQAIERRRLLAYEQRQPWVLEDASEVLDLLQGSAAGGLVSSP